MPRSLKRTLRADKKRQKSTLAIVGTQTTFIVEALALMVCLMMVIAVSIATIAYSVQANEYYAHKESAITLASNIAEKFAANPNTIEDVYYEGDLRAVCDVESALNATGTLYDATISVEWNDVELYLLETTKYSQNGDDGADGDGNDDADGADGADGANASDIQKGSALIDDASAKAGDSDGSTI